MEAGIAIVPQIDGTTEEQTPTVEKVVVKIDEMIEAEMIGGSETIDGLMTDIDAIDEGQMIMITEIETGPVTIDTANEDTSKTTDGHEVGAQSTENDATTIPTGSETDDETTIS
jgi:hypothetical protein